MVTQLNYHHNASWRKSTPPPATAWGNLWTAPDDITVHIVNFLLCLIYSCQLFYDNISKWCKHWWTTIDRMVNRICRVWDNGLVTVITVLLTLSCSHIEQYLRVCYQWYRRNYHLSHYFTYCLYCENMHSSLLFNHVTKNTTCMPNKSCLPINMCIY